MELSGKALKGFKIVTHLKPPYLYDQDKEQLVQTNDLELDLHFPEQGVRFEFNPSPDGISYSFFL
jgi:hypothetical protein